ncbi:MAG: hypothetical protein AABW99_00710 [archaeon]
MQNKATEICILVHPLFDSITNWNHEITSSPQEKRFRKRLLSAWNLAAQRQANSGNPFLVVVHPDINGKVERLHNLSGFNRTIGKEGTAAAQEQIVGEYRRFIARLEKLGAKFIFKAVPDEAILELVKGFHPNKPLDLKVFGEYEELCAKAVQRMSEESLRKIGISGNVRLVKELCRPHDPSKFVLYKGVKYFRKYRSRHERRQAQMKKKKAKLR